MNERRERGWRGEWDALPGRPTCAPLQAACRRPLTKPPLMRRLPGLFRAPNGERRQPTLLQGSHFLQSTLDRTGPSIRAVGAGSECRRQKLGTCPERARALGEPHGPAGGASLRWASASGLAAAEPRSSILPEPQHLGLPFFGSFSNRQRRHFLPLLSPSPFSLLPSPLLLALSCSPLFAIIICNKKTKPQRNTAGLKPCGGREWGVEKE